LVRSAVHYRMIAGEAVHRRGVAVVAVTGTRVVVQIIQRRMVLGKSVRIHGGAIDERRTKIVMDNKDS
jgi:hypothetical protein